MPQVLADAFENAFFAVPGFLFACVLISVTCDQGRHSKINFASHIQVPVFIPSRHFLAFDLFRQLVRSVHPNASIATSLAPTDSIDPVALFMNRHIVNSLLWSNGF